MGSNGREEEWKKLKEEYHHVQVPEEAMERINRAIDRAKEDKKRKRRFRLVKRFGAGLAAAALVLVLLPNMSADVAMAMERVPLLGGLVRVFTFGRYDYEDEDREAKVEIPQIAMSEEAPPSDPEAGETTGGESQPAAAKEGKETAMEDAAPEAAPRAETEVNEEILAYIEPIVQEFKDGLDEEGKKTLEIGYEVLTDNDRWFSMRVNVLEIQASGYEYGKYFNIDKSTGEKLTLEGLFSGREDFLPVISEEIKRQMREQMAADEGKIYFLDSDMPEDDFDTLTADHNFYLNAEGELVIPFDEYEVAPGYMGRVEFTIPLKVLEPKL